MAFSPSTCEICFNNFISQQTNLFVLSCSHPICELCIKSICIDQSIVCPVCWKMTQLHTSSGSLLCSRNQKSIDVGTGAKPMLQESLVSKHVPVQEKQIQNEEDQILVLKIENGSCRIQRMMTEMAIEKHEQKVGNLNAVCKEVICHGNNDLIKQQENGNPVEMEIVNGKLRLKVPKDKHDQPSMCLSEDVTIPKTDLKTTPKNVYGNMAAVEIKTGPNEKIENLKTTGSTSNQETNFENRKDSNPLIPILQPGTTNFFIPKFGAHRSPSKHYRVKIMAVFDPSRMYVQIVDDDLRRLDSLIKQLQLQLRPLSRNDLTKSAIRNPTKGCVCAVLVSGFWQRGIVQSQIIPDTVHETVQVMIVDTGFCCLVPPLHIQRLHPIYMELPAQAVRCKLSNIQRFELKNNGKLPLKSVDGYGLPRVMDVIQTKRDKMAELSVFDFVSGAVRSTPRICETTLLVTMVVDGELNSVNQQVDDAIADAVSTKNEHTTNESFLQTVTGTTAKCLRRRTRTHSKPNRSRIPVTHSTALTNADVPDDIRVIVKTVSPSRNTSNNYQSSAITRRSNTSCQKKIEAEQKDKSLRMDMWSFADLKTTLPPCFDGVVTWVDGNGGLYVHDCKWSKQLSLIRNTLNATFNRPHAIKGDLRYQLEDHCLVKHESNWYRAIIRAVKKDRNTATVFFIDYGATVDVKLTDIRMDTTLKDIPAHTFRCSLYNLVPPGIEKFDVGATWPDTVINYFHATVVNQEFNMTVKCYSPLIIAMRLLKNSMDLTDFMVTARAGEYINQS